MIPLVDLKAQYAGIREEIMPAITEVIASGRFIGGPAVAGFENMFREFCEVGHVVGCANGTDALEIALWALGIGDKDEVICPSHTFIATAEAILRAGARPVFADIEPETHLLDPASVERNITERTRAVIPVHLYGQPCEMDSIMAVARRNHLWVIEDCAQAHGARYDGKRVGTFGELGMYSFYPGKNLGAYGDGGAIVTNNHELARKIKMYANHGRNQKYLHDFPGVNSRLDAIQAAVLTAKLKHLEEWNQKRAEAAQVYHRLLDRVSDLVLPAHAPRRSHVYHLYVVQVPDGRRDDIIRQLKSDGVEAGVHYPVPLHEQPAFVHLGYRPEDLPVTHRVASRIISLPMFPEITQEQIGAVARALTSAIASR
ncbi:MAG: DegT/DnrJ/EryC1/StrS family aminotransferase [Deltaproteobacteria bacterium]|nr:DegT/DnrJ/EryC1/StrS family aminotransferase [Deltaproteobacteria bacterium]MBW2307186.1 DegT/DnrJ/EryC1/StrS family aminotransferase [Deltaproteobacteria bacterium]